MGKISVGLRLDRELLDRVNAARGDVPKNRWIERAIEAALARSGSLEDQVRALPNEGQDLRAGELAGYLGTDPETADKVQQEVAKPRGRPTIADTWAR